MTATPDQEMIREIISASRYLTLSTTDGTEPWIAPLEYMHDDDLNFYFLSTDRSRHARDIEQNPTVAVAIFADSQPDYSPTLSATLRGVQIRATARRLLEAEYPEAVSAAIDALQPPIPPYSAFVITPTQFFLPKIIDGVNERVEIEMANSSHREPAAPA